MALIILDKDISCIAKHRIPYGSMVSKRLLANNAGVRATFAVSLSANSSTG